MVKTTTLKITHMTVKGIVPLVIIEVNDTYILGVYQGSLSDYDLLLRYRQKDENTKSGWSRIRTPKHILDALQPEAAPTIMLFEDEVALVPALYPIKVFDPPILRHPF